MLIQVVKLAKMTQLSIIKEIKESKSYVIILTLYAFLFMFFCSKLSPLYPSNEWADVNVYYNIGKAIMNGRVLYTESFDPKGPLIFIIYGLGYLVSNTTFIGVFLIYFMAWAMTLTFSFITLRRQLNGNSYLAMLGSLFIPILSLPYMHSGGSVEELILLLQVVSLLSILEYFTNNTKELSAIRMCLLGIASAAIFFLKLNLTAGLLFLLAGLFIDIAIYKKYQTFLKQASYYLLGILIISLPICLYLYLNAALVEAFDIYILLNLKLSSDLTFTELMSKGAGRIYDMLRTNTVGAVLCFVGAFYFPIKHIKNKIGKFTFISSACALLFFIFFGGVFHFYYPLPLYAYSTLGILSVLLFLNKQIQLIESRKLVLFSVLASLLLCLGTTKLFDMGGKALIGGVSPSGVGYDFSRIIAKEANPTLLNLAFGDTNSIFTLCNIVPNVKYFTGLNIDPIKYPQLRNEQTKYIENQVTQFIVINNITPSIESYNYFSNLDALKKNYTLIATYNGEEEYQHGKYPCTTYLYKRKNEK